MPHRTVALALALLFTFAGCATSPPEPARHEAVQESPAAEATPAAEDQAAREPVEAEPPTDRPEWLEPGGQVRTTSFPRDGFLPNPTGLERITLLSGHADYADALAVSPDGTVAATGGRDGRIILWEIASLRPTATLAGHRDQVTTLLFLDDQRLASASNDGTARVWNITTRGETRRFSCAPTVRELAGGSTELIWIDWSGVVSVDPDGEAPPQRVADLPRAVVMTGPDSGDWLLVGDYDGSVFRVDISSRVVERTAYFTEARMLALTVSRDGQWVATAGSDRVVSLFHAASGERKWSVTLEDPASDLEFTRDGETILVSQDRRGPLMVLDAATGTVERTWDGLLSERATFVNGSDAVVGITERSLYSLPGLHAEPAGTKSRLTNLRAATLSSDGTLLALSGAVSYRGNSASAQPVVYDLAGNEQQQITWLRGAFPTGMAFSPGSHLLASNRGSSVRLGDPTADRLVAEYDGLPSYVDELAWTPGGDAVVVGVGPHEQEDGSRMRGLACLDGESLQPRWITVVPEMGDVDSLRPVDGGEAFLVLTDDGVLKVAIGDGSILYRTDDENRSIHAMAVDDTGGRFWTFAWGGQLEIRDLGSGDVLLETRPADGPRRPSTGRYLPEWDALAVGDRTGTVFLMDARTAEPRALLQAHTDQVIQITWSPDLGLLTTASEDGTVRFWDAKTPRLAATVVPLGLVSGAADTAVVVVGADGLVEHMGDATETLKIEDDNRTAVDVRSRLRTGIARAAITGTRPDPPESVVFQSRAVERAVRESIGRPSGLLLPSDVDGVRELDLSGRGLSELPSEVQRFTELRILDISGNGISHLPEWLAELEQIEEFRIGGNPITSIGEAAMRSWDLRSASDEFSELSSRIERIERLWDLRRSIAPNPPELEDNRGVLTVPAYRLETYAVSVLPNYYFARRAFRPDDLPPGYRRPPDTRAVGAFFVRETAIPVFLLEGEPHRFLVDTDLDGDVRDETPVELHHAFMVRLPTAPVLLTIMQVEEQISAHRDYEGRQLPIVGYRSTTTVIAPLDEDTMLFIEDRDSNGYVDDGFDYLAVARRSTAELTAAPVPDHIFAFDGQQYRLVHESPGTVTISTLEPEPLRRSRAWQTDEPLYLRFNRQRWMDGTGVTSHEGLAHAAPDGRFIVAETFFSFGEISRLIHGGGGGGGGALVVHDGHGMPLPAPGGQAPAPHTYVETAGDGMIYLPTFAVSESQIDLTWNAPAVTDYERDESAAPKPLTLPFSALPQGTPTGSRSLGCTIADRQDGHYLITLGTGSQRALAVVSESGRIRATFPTGEYQYPVFGENPDQIIYGVNGHDSDTYLVDRAERRSFVYRQSGESREVLIEQAIAFTASSDASRLLYLRPNTRGNTELRLFDVGTGDDYPVSFGVRVRALNEIGFIGDTGHVYHADGDRLIVDEHDTGITGSSFVFGGHHLFRLHDHTYVSRHPNLLESLAGAEGIWADGEPPWELAGLRQSLHEIARLQGRDAQAALDAVEALSVDRPDQPGWIDVQHRRLSCLLSLDRYQEMQSEIDLLNRRAARAGLGTDAFAGWERRILEQKREYASLFQMEMAEYHADPERYDDIRTLGRYGRRQGDAAAAYEAIKEIIARKERREDQQVTVGDVEHAALYAVLSGNISEAPEWKARVPALEQARIPQRNHLWGNPVGASFSIVFGRVTLDVALTPLLADLRGDTDALGEGLLSLMWSYDADVEDVLWAAVVYNRHPELRPWGELRQTIGEAKGADSEMAAVAAAVDAGEDLDRFVEHEQEETRLLRRALVALLRDPASARTTILAFNARGEELFWQRILEYELDVSEELHHE